MQDFKEWVKNRPLKKIIISCRDHENNLEKLLNHIKSVGNTGHSFSILVDAGTEDEQKFFWDGDGSDYIKSIEIDKVEETMTSTSCVASYPQPLLADPKKRLISEKKKKKN